jgi:hypothetical protein
LKFTKNFEKKFEKKGNPFVFFGYNINKIRDMQELTLKEKLLAALAADAAAAPKSDCCKARLVTVLNYTTQKGYHDAKACNACGEIK